MSGNTGNGFSIRPGHYPRRPRTPEEIAFDAYCDEREKARQAAQRQERQRAAERTSKWERRFHSADVLGYGNHYRWRR